MRQIFRCVIAALSFSLFAGLASCDKDDDKEKNQMVNNDIIKNDTINNEVKDEEPDIPVWESQKGIVISSSLFAIEGQDVEITASINPENNYGVTGIKSMVVEWNGDVADSISTAPFIFKKKVIGETDSRLIVSVKVEYKTAKNVYVKNEDVNILGVCKENGIAFSHSMQGYNTSELRNEDILSGKINAYIGDGARYIYYIYIDDEVVHVAKTFPDNYSYKLNGLSVGSHKVYTEIVNVDDDGNRISEQNKTLERIIKIIN